jgi:EpsI family protein
VKNIDRKHAVVILILALTAAFTSFIGNEKIPPQSDVFTKKIPYCVGPWVGGKDIEVDARTIETLETNDVLTREYSGPKGVSIMLCIAFSGESRKAVHPPEICLSGGGWNLTEKKLITVPGEKEFEAIKLVLEMGDSKHVVLYWYKAGKDFTADFYNQQFSFVKNILMGGDVSCGLIRVSTLIKEDTSVEEALSWLTDFAQALMPYLTEGDRTCQETVKESG